MPDVDTLIDARWIVPVRPHRVLLEHHSLVIDGGLVRDLLPSAAARERYQAKHRVRLPHHLVMPGLVNAHTHSPMTLFRGLADDLPLMDWLNQHVWPAETRWVSETFVRDGSRLAIAEMLRGGTTCFNDMYFFPETTARIASDLGMRAVVGLILVDLPTVYAKDADEYLDKAIQVHDQVRHDPLVSTMFAPHAPYSVADQALRKVAVLAEELDIPVHMHVHETADEVAGSLAQHGRRPLQRLDDLGLLSPRMTAVHMTQLDANEIRRAADCGISVVHCPESNMKLASGICPVQALADAGINVALGTDGAASNNDLNMIGEMRSAALLGKIGHGEASAVSAWQVLEMATINGARALGLDHRIGSLETGKAADLAAVDLHHLETQPVYNPVSQLVYAAGRHQVSDVWVQGRHLVRDGQPVGIDMPDLMSRTQDWQRRIHEHEDGH